MVEGSVPAVEPDRPDVANAEGSAAVHASPSAVASGRSRMSRRNRGIGVFRALKRLWIPLVIVAVLAGGGFAVSRLHGVFGSDRTISYSDTRNDDTQSFNPKHMRYEIFGPPGTIAQISYFGANGDPTHEDEVQLPWSLEFPISGAADIGSVAAQGDSDSIGCRILVDGVVKSEKVATHDVSTFASCQLKAA